jgi:heptose I phosphotransferase
VASITRELHENGINHRDLYICHFLLNESELQSLIDLSELPLYLIDLHRVQIRPKTPQRWLIKDLAALYFSSMDIGFTKRDFYRFVREYSKNSLKTEFRNNKEFWIKVEKKALRLWAKHLKY